MNSRMSALSIWTVSVATLLVGLSAFADVPELFCTINDSGENLVCQYKDKRNSTKAFGADDVMDFIDRSVSGGAYITVKSKRGFERAFEVDADSNPYKKLKDAKGNVGVSELARMKLDLFQTLERKAIQTSDGLDAIFIQSDILKYDPAVANDKCKMDMKVYSSGVTYEKNLESLTAENKALSIYLTSLLKAFKEPGSCLGEYKVEVSGDGTVELNQLQGLAQAFRNRCKKKM